MLRESLGREAGKRLSHPIVFYVPTSLCVAPWNKREKRRQSRLTFSDRAIANAPLFLRWFQLKSSSVNVSFATEKEKAMTTFNVFNDWVVVDEFSRRYVFGLTYGRCQLLTPFLSKLVVTQTQVLHFRVSLQCQTVIFIQQVPWLYVHDKDNDMTW